MGRESKTKTSHEIPWDFNDFQNSIKNNIFLYSNISHFFTFSGDKKFHDSEIITKIKSENAILFYLYSPKNIILANYE